MIIDDDLDVVLFRLLAQLHRWDDQAAVPGGEDLWRRHFYDCQGQN